DKDVDGIIAALDRSRALRGARIIATQVPGERALAAADLAPKWRSARPAARIDALADVSKALQAAFDRAPGTIVVAGSLYLVGEARRPRLERPPTRDPEVPGE